MPRNTAASKTGTVEPRYNGVPRDTKNWGTKNCSLYQGLRLIYRNSFTYIEVPLSSVVVIFPSFLLET